MEIAELSKKLFNGKEVRILGTVENPLFVADDIGNIVGLKKIRNTIANFDNDERVARLVGTRGGEQQMTLLTEDGLYRLLFISRKEEAKIFQKWVCKVIREIRLNGRYDLREDIARQQLQKTLEEKDTIIKSLEQRAHELSQAYKPTVVYHEFDINEFTDEPCVYLISLTDHDYKFGVSGEIDCRSSTHFSKFRKLGLDPKIIKLWKCKSMKIMKDTEMKIKLFTKHNNILVNKYDQREIITTDDIMPIIENITKYIGDQNLREDSSIEIKKMEMKLAKLQAVNRSKELDNEGKRLDIELRKLNMHIRAPMHRPMSTGVRAPMYRTVYHDNIDDFIRVKQPVGPLDNVQPMVDQPAVDQPIDPPIVDQPVMQVVAPPIVNLPVIVQPAVDQPTLVQPLPVDTAAWVRNNPPSVGQHAQAYYERYKASGVRPQDVISIHKFRKLVEQQGFENKKKHGFQTWFHRG